MDESNRIKEDCATQRRVHFTRGSGSLIYKDIVSYNAYYQVSFLRLLCSAVDWAWSADGQSDAVC